LTPRPTLLDTQHQAISRLMSLEKSRDSFHHIQLLKGGPKGTSISQVGINGTFGPQLISGRTNVENALCQALQKCFTKAHSSPFLHCQLLADVSLLSCSPAAKEILEGTYHCLDDADNYTKLFLKALKWLMPHPELVSTVLSPENICTHWHRAKVLTSSSISGLHFGHYKAAISNDLLTHLHACFMQLVFMTSISQPSSSFGKESWCNSCRSSVGHPPHGS